MKKRGYEAYLELREDKLFRVVVEYKPGSYVLHEFAYREIKLDGTFLKNNMAKSFLSLAATTEIKCFIWWPSFGVQRDLRC